eukprot:gene24325-29180_t
MTSSDRSIPAANAHIASTPDSFESPNEPEVDDADVMAALTLIPKARAEMEQLEALFLGIARERGMTWQDIAFGLGLGSTQAARQRYERLVRRTGG